MTDQPSGGEFDIISKHFKPLSQGDSGALGLLDDAALLSVPPGFELAVTTDAVVAGVHFLDSLSPEDIAHKVVGVNLSDLAAMGAQPKAVFLAAQFTADQSEEWIAAFAAGMREALAPSGAVLMGGDTVVSPGPLAFTLTAMGHVGEGRALKRAAAQAEDLVLATGTIGDGALGLALLQGGLELLDEAHKAHLARRYARPEPRWALMADLAAQNLVRSAVDVSDGLVADLGHVCAASGLDAVLDAETIPLSDAAQAALRFHPDLMRSVLSGGDDYEVVFTAEARHKDAIQAAAAQWGVPVTVIGRMEHQGVAQKVCGRSVCVIDQQGHPIETGAGGYRHL